MTKDEMKNKISMELQSPTAQQGFEIICKHLVELEQENKELQTKINSQGWEIEDLNLSLQTTNEQKVKLEQENELAKSLLYCAVKSCDNCGNCNCENFQRQRKSVPCELYVSYQDRIKQLEEQIEKMKCCQNCKNYTWNMSNKKCQFRCESREACDNWKLKEIKEND